MRTRLHLDPLARIIAQLEGPSLRFGLRGRKHGAGGPSVPTLAAFYEADKLAYAPPVQENPVEPGVAVNAARPGTGLEPVIGNNFVNRQYDGVTDVRITGSASGSVQLNGVRTGNFFLTGGRRAAIFAADFSPPDPNTSAPKVQLLYQKEHMYCERVRLSKPNTNDSLALIDDVFYLAGDITGGASMLTMQACLLEGGRGTNKESGPALTLTGIAVVSGKVRLTTSAAHGLTVGQHIHLADTAVDGVVRIDQDNNMSFYVSAVPTTTTFEVGTYTSFFPPVITGVLSLGVRPRVWPRVLASSGVASAISAISMVSATRVRITTSAAHGLSTTTHANQQIRVAGVTNVAFNTNFIFKETVNSTVYEADAVEGSTVPANGTASSGGTATRYSYPVGLHSDCIQAGSVNDNKFSEIRLDTCTFDGNYQLIIVGAVYDNVGGSPVHRYGNKKLKLSRFNGRRNTLQPRDPHGSSLFYLSDSNGVRLDGGRVTDDTDFIDTWLTPLPGKDLTLGGFSPNMLGTSDGLPMGPQSATVDGLLNRWLDHPNFDGVIFEAARPTDFCTPAMVGPASPEIAYSNVVAPSAAQITALALSSATVTADLVRGSYLFNNNLLPSISGEVGVVSTTNSLSTGVLDITLTDDAGGRFKMLANRLVRGKEPVLEGSYSVDFLVTVRGTAVTKAFLDVPITVTAGEVTSDANAELTTLTRYMFAPPAVASARRLAMDAYITALKAAGVWAKLKYLSFEAVTDKRDVVIDWKNPTNPDLIEAGGDGVTKMTFTVDKGYNGISNAAYFTKTSMFTGAELGLGQNDATMIVGARLQDGLLPTGTDYLMGNDALYVAISTAGKITGRQQGVTTFTSTPTPFVAADTTMRYIAVARNIGTAFNLFVGSKGTDFSGGATEVITNNSNVIATTTTNQMRQHSKSPDQAVNRKQIHFTALATYLTAAEVNAFRAATDTYLTHLGIS